ncbi:hypothetical protein L1987_20059 [Smallanthus sonchifolius]|uniref:Uncharacterized protein n=1 Tax=Smallanthus sonchifolius TaxID=185202 RepID=A0ACB9ITQ1_9ASTR|nr:hypothetical protein L1987_20059 [Smallanthus sonchifolius]
MGLESSSRPLFSKQTKFPACAINLSLGFLIGDTQRWRFTDSINLESSIGRFVNLRVRVIDRLGLIDLQIRVKISG